MPQKTIQLGEAKEFAQENGYLLAVYKKEDDKHYKQIESHLWDTPLEDDTPIIVKTTGTATDFNEFITADGEYCFRLHNNLNIPEIIPIFNNNTPAINRR